MAANAAIQDLRDVWSEDVQLNETLTSLRSTSKGQLRYDGEGKINEDISSQLTYSFESFLAESASATHSINASICGLSLDESTSSEVEDETTLVSSFDGRDQKANTVGMSIHFDSGNELSIRKYHDDCRGNAELRREERARILERRMRNIKQGTEQSLRYNQECLTDERKLFEQEITEWKQEDATELRRHKIALDEQAKERKRKLDEIYTRALIEESHLARKKEEARAILEKLNKTIVSLYHQIAKNIEMIQQKFNESKHMSFVEAHVHEDIQSLLTGISGKAEGVLAGCKALSELSDAEDYLDVMNNLLESTLVIENKVTDILEVAAMAALKKKEMEEAEKSKLEEMKQEEQRKLEMKEQLKASEAKSDEKLPTVKQAGSKEKPNVSTEKLWKYISENALMEYTKLQEHLTTVQASFKEFTSDPKQTEYKVDLQKAVNVPINAISAHSPSQLNDKISRLVILLSGNSVEVGGKRVNCKGHPSALVFCKDLVARKLVVQGAQQVSFNPASAFLYAAVIVGIWSAFPDVGQLILAHFHRSYPYLVPYYMPQVEGQSKNDYHKALGYSGSNDKIEDEDNFLKKFSGTVQLYAAVVSSKGATTPDHPHGINKGWTWLARTLNLQPHSSITATMLFEFIKVAGHLLMERYRKQFQKLLLMLCKKFIPAIEIVTPPEKRGPIQRLKDFLEECIKSHRIPVPKGYLSERWWQGGHF